ncbi:MAG: hypothetical protein BWZ10_03131 [candidate division BRC1 bacterium ADurb.BinA364]|nr:MAG: hypothetical protein BWZ10_03131 [candidate division BRC1 bacterium ADurb.BinA364]
MRGAQAQEQLERRFAQGPNLAKGVIDLIHIPGFDIIANALDRSVELAALDRAFEQRRAGGRRGEIALLGFEFAPAPIEREPSQRAGGRMGGKSRIERGRGFVGDIADGGQSLRAGAFGGAQKAGNFAGRAGSENLRWIGKPERAAGRQVEPCRAGRQPIAEWDQNEWLPLAEWTSRRMRAKNEPARGMDRRKGRLRRSIRLHARQAK